MIEGVPTLEELEEGTLGDVLSFLLAAREQDDGPEQPRPFRSEERIEGRHLGVRRLLGQLDLS